MVCGEELKYIAAGGVDGRENDVRIWLPTAFKGTDSGLTCF